MQKILVKELGMGNILSIRLWKNLTTHEFDMRNVDYIHIARSWEFSETFGMGLRLVRQVLFQNFKKVYGLAGMTMSIAEEYSPFMSFDRINFHEGFTWKPLDRLIISFLLIESKYPTISAGLNYCILN